MHTHLSHMQSLWLPIASRIYWCSQKWERPLSDNNDSLDTTGIDNITNSNCCGEWTDFAKDSVLVATPTLVAFEGGEVVVRQAGSQSFTSDFFRGMVETFTSTIPNK